VVGLATLYAGMFSALLGLRAAAAANDERMLELDLEETRETLADRLSYLHVLNEIGLERVWTREQLLQAIDGWADSGSSARLGFSSQSIPSLMRSFLMSRPRSERVRAAPLVVTAARIGSVDFGRLLTTSGIALGLIEERQDSTLGQGSWVWARVR
jgi:hypothetical protein